MTRCRWLVLLVVCAGVSRWGQAQECLPVPFPRGFIPFTSVYLITGTAGRGQLVVGAPGPGGTSEIAARLPVPWEYDATYCDQWVELAPGRLFSGVWVPTVAERMGDFSASRDSGGVMLIFWDPFTNLPFPGNIIPRSRWNELFAFRVRGAQTQAGGPAIAENGIISATGDKAGVAAAPGGLISIYGTNLAPIARKAPTSVMGLVPQRLEDVQVRIGGRYAPLLYVSPGQINAQVPFEVAPGSQAVTVARSGSTSATYSLTVSALAPAIFAGAFLKNADFSLVSAENPARPGDVLLVYCTGLGAVRPAVASGTLAPATPLSLTVETPRVTVAGVEARVVYALLSPGFVGLYQIAFVAPETLPPGSAAVVVIAGATASASKDLRTQGAAVAP